jgi:hypothetical protein
LQPLRSSRRWQKDREDTGIPAFPPSSEAGSSIRIASMLVPCDAREIRKTELQPRKNPSWKLDAELRMLYTGFHVDWLR